jgi:hypothetical protein
VDRAWQRFARENSGEALVEEEILGRPLWDFLAGSEVTELYRLLFRRVRASGKSVAVPFRCDGPDLRRAMELEITPGAEGILELRTRLLDARSQERVRLLDAHAVRHPHHLVRMCSWCLRVEERGIWWKVERFLVRRPMLAREPVPRITHGICPGCAWEMAQALDSAA